MNDNTRFRGVLTLMRRELKGHARGRRAPIVFGVFLAIMVLVLAGVLVVAEVSGARGDPTVGQVLFVGLAVTQTALILLLGPVFTAGAIAGERERQTFETLVATRLSSGGIVLGKAAGALVFQALLVASSLPLMALAYVYGGVGPGTVFAVYAWDVLLMVWVVSLALCASAFSQRTLWAAVITYVLVFFAVFLTGFLEGVQMAVRGATGSAEPISVFLYANPFAGLWELALPGAREEMIDALGAKSFVLWGGLVHAVASAGALALAVWAVSPLRRPGRGRV